MRVLQQDRERPKNDEKQKKYDSGQQKSHTFKNQIIIIQKGEEVVVGERGRESDLNLFKKQQKKFDQEQRFQRDQGDQGGEKVDTPTIKETRKCQKKQRKRISEKLKKEYS